MYNADRELIEVLQSVLDELDCQRRYLYTTRTGCECDKTGLCGLHAEVFNRLQAASDSIAQAIAATRQE